VNEGAYVFIITGRRERELVSAVKNRPCDAGQMPGKAKKKACELASQHAFRASKAAVPVINARPITNAQPQLGLIAQLRYKGTSRP
jgi:hypothetical protein